MFITTGISDKFNSPPPPTSTGRPAHANLGEDYKIRKGSG